VSAGPNFVECARYVCIDVCMYEERVGTNYVTDSVVGMPKEQPSQIKNYHQEEIKKIVEEKIATEDLSIDNPFF
jgi:hypothetical protein